MTDLAKWLGIVLSAGALLASGVYAFAQRPTRDEVDDRIEDKQAPVAAAVLQATKAIEQLTDETKKLREAAIRDEVRRELQRQEGR